VFLLPVRGSPGTVGTHRQRALLERSRTYAILHADPRIAERTFFFAAAALVTRTLWIYRPSPFLLGLSASLERENLRRAAAIRAGVLFQSGPPDINTRRFIAVEQRLVQGALDALRAQDPRAYAREIRSANRALRWARRGTLRALIERPFVVALDATFAALGGSFDMAVRDCREVLGMALARAAGGRLQPGGRYSAARTAAAIACGSNTGVEQLFAVQANAAARGNVG